MDYSKWNSIDSDDDETQPTSEWETNSAHVAAARLREAEGGLTVAQQTELLRSIPAGVRTACEQCDAVLAQQPRCGEEELRLLIGEVCRPGFLERWTAGGPISAQPPAEGAIPGWQRLVDLLETNHWLRGVVSEGDGIHPSFRRLTDMASQPLTALAALQLSGADIGLRVAVVHVVGAVNGPGGNESLGGDEKWRLLQALLPGNPELEVVYVGPEAAPQPARLLQDRPGRAAVRVSAHRELYECFMQPADKARTPRRPSLFFAQHSGLNHGPLVPQWRPCLAYVRARGIPCALSFFDAGERERSIQLLSSALPMMSQGAVLYDGRAPFASLFLGFMAGDVFSINNQLLLLSFPPPCQPAASGASTEVAAGASSLHGSIAAQGADSAKALEHLADADEGTLDGLRAMVGAHVTLSGLSVSELNGLPMRCVSVSKTSAPFRIAVDVGGGRTVSVPASKIVSASTGEGGGSL